MGCTVHPPGDHHRWAAAHTSIDILSHPDCAVALPGNPVPAGGSITPNVAEEGIARHIHAVRAGCRGQGGLHCERWQTIILSLLVEECHHLALQAGIVDR